MEKNSNDLLVLGTSILIIGLLLASYSYSSYSEIKTLSDKIDFEELDNNNQLQASEKYYKYLSYADFLNEKLTKNKNILIKNASCTYLDYAYHNAIELYKLTYKKMAADDTKRSVTAGNVRTLYNMLDYYNTCKQTSEYKSKLEKLLEEIQNSNLNNINTDIRREKPLNNYEYQQKPEPPEETYPSLPQLDPIPPEDIIEPPQFEKKPSS